jgi:hypothetical protein
MERERPQAPRADLLFYLPAGPDEDGRRAGLVDRDLAARGLGTFGPPQLQQVAPGVDNGDYHPVAVPYGLIFRGRHDGVGTLDV